MPKNLKITKKKFENFSRKFFFGGSKSDFFSFSHFHQKRSIFLDRFFRLKYTSGSALSDSFSKLLRSASEEVEKRGWKWSTRPFLEIFWLFHQIMDYWWYLTNCDVKQHNNECQKIIEDFWNFQKFFFSVVKNRIFFFVSKLSIFSKRRRLFWTFFSAQNILQVRLYQKAFRNCCARHQKGLKIGVESGRLGNFWRFLKNSKNFQKFSIIFCQSL